MSLCITIDLAGKTYGLEVLDSNIEVCMNMYVRTYVCMYVCMYIYVYIYVCMYECIYVFMHVCLMNE